MKLEVKLIATIIYYMVLLLNFKIKNFNFYIPFGLSYPKRVIISRLGDWSQPDKRYSHVTWKYCSLNFFSLYIFFLLNNIQKV